MVKPLQLQQVSSLKAYNIIITRHHTPCLVAVWDNHTGRVPLEIVPTVKQSFFMRLSSYVAMY